VEARTAQLSGALRELQEAQGQLVQQEKMASLGRVVAGVAHEINNPLNFVHGNMHHLESYARSMAAAIEAYEGTLRASANGESEAVRAIREKHDLDYLLGDLRSVLDACEEGLDRSLGIVKDLRTFSRIDRAEPSRMDVVEALESTLTLLAGRLRGLRVERQLAPLPPIACLAGQVKQVFMNLIVNAADAVEPGGRIAIRARSAGEQVVVEVEDDGCGIPSEQLDRIFEPFYTTKEVGRGTGLGLAISYGVVKRHGGEIHVDSQPGRGTCFRVELPVVFRGQEEAASQGSRPPGEQPKKDAR